MKDVTLLIAHPDDESIFLWPFLDRVKRIVCASNDSDNPSRRWCLERGVCLSEVGQLLGCEVTCFAYSSEFYRKDTRSEDLKRTARHIANALRGAEIIATHNAWGEYGHLDHILCHNIARTIQAETKCQVLVTDIAQEINWLPVRPWKQGDYTTGFIGAQHIERPLYDRIKKIYDSRGCWTWSDSLGIAEECRVYSL